MSRGIGSELPQDALVMLDGADVEDRIGATFQLLTVDEDGWPRVALLSVGEVLAISATLVRFALWPGSSTTANLTRSDRATLAFGVGDVAYYIRLRATRGPDLDVRGIGHAYFEASSEQALVDRVNYARLSSWVTFELPEPGPVVERWRATLDALRAVDSPRAHD